MFTSAFVVFVSVLQVIQGVPVEGGFETSGGIKLGGINLGGIKLAGSNGIDGKVNLGGIGQFGAESKLQGSSGIEEVKLAGSNGIDGKGADSKLQGSSGTEGDVKLGEGCSSKTDSLSVELGSLIKSLGDHDDGLVMKLINAAYQIEQAKLNALGNVAEGALDGISSATKIPVKVLNLAIEIARNISTGVGLRGDLKIDLSGLVDSAGDLASTLINAAWKLEEIKMNAIKNAIAIAGDAASAGLKIGADITNKGVDTVTGLAKTGFNIIGDGLSAGLGGATNVNLLRQSIFNRANGKGSGTGSADASFGVGLPSNGKGSGTGSASASFGFGLPSNGKGSGTGSAGASFGVGLPSLAIGF